MMPPTRAPGQIEFIALMAMLFATVAFSIDAMLPALPQIAAELTPAAPNLAQLILSSFVLGMGIGTLLAGPLSDALGRRPVMLAGAALYCAGVGLAWASPTLEGVLLGRLIQGLGAAAPRVVALAVVRDLHSGRQMARIVSFAMMVFTLVPAVAPLAGQAVMGLGGWRAIFPAFLVFSLIATLWLYLRQPETLPAPARRPLARATLLAALRELAANRVILLSILAQGLWFGALFGTLSSTQQVFDVTFGVRDTFPLWFAVIALVAGTASLLNAALVMRLGMRRIVRGGFLGQAVFSVLMAALGAAQVWPPTLAFAAWMVWVTGVFFLTGLIMGNLNALAMEPVGHIAGIAASVVGSVATVIGVAVAVPLGLVFDGTPVPLMTGVALLAAAAFGLTRALPPPA